jgi:alpha-tubulin suppressor-like RCC1 family protein
MNMSHNQINESCTLCSTKHNASEHFDLTLVHLPGVRNRRKLSLVFPDEVTRERWLIALDVLLSSKQLPRNNSGSESSTPTIDTNGTSSTDITGIVTGWQESAGMECPGDVYVWGKDVYLTCDEKNQPRWRDAWKPRMLPGSLPLDVDDAAVGQQFGALVDNEADVYVWGRNTRGIGGRGITQQRSNLTEVDVLAGFGANSVSCGASHVVVASQKGHLWTWGSTGESPATIAGSDTAVQSLPKPVPGAAFRDVAVQVSCGGWHTLVLGASGQLYSWGEGLFGALGHGTTDDQVCPSIIFLLCSICRLQ